MEEQNLSIKDAGLKFGLITGFGLILYALVLHLLGLAADQSFGWISYLILITGLIYGINEYKKSNNGIMPYGKGLGVGTLIAAIAGSIDGFFTYLYVKFIDDSIISIILEKQIESFEERGMDEEQIDQAIFWTEKFLTPAMMMFSAFFQFLFVGFILTLIIAAIMKKTSDN